MVASESSDLAVIGIVYLVVVIGIAVGCGYGARAIMVGKGRSGASGCWLGFFLGLLGLLIAALLSATPEHEMRKQQQMMSMMGGAPGYQPYAAQPFAAQPYAAQPSAAAQAGQWAADPFGRHQLRYHDGTRWTESVSDSGVTGFDPAEARAVPVAAGQWAPDPYRRHELRYFDGTNWTAAVSNGGTTATDPPG